MPPLSKLTTYSSISQLKPQKRWITSNTLNQGIISHRRITIYNLRMSSPSRKLIMRAIDDFNCYSFEARKLEEAKCVHKDHVYDATEIDYSPTCRKFLTGSYDRTARSE
ncbi:hypothetical protein LXL04_021112 [Taraxacum kok-saghyz]